MFFYLIKRAFLQDEKFRKEEDTLYLFKVIFTKMCFTTFSLEISQELLQITSDFIVNFFSFGTLSQKSISWFPSCTVKYISKRVIILTFQIYIRNLNVV